MNASLQGLLHDTLVVSGHVESCAIFKKKDFSIVAASIGYQVYSKQPGLLQILGTRRASS